MAKAKFIKKIPVAKNIFSFEFEAPGFPVYQAGQYTEIILPHDPPDDRGVKRWFTLSASPTEANRAITTKFTSPKGSSFKAKLAELSEGTELELAEPEGDFVLPEDDKQKLVLVAGGIGVTPYRSFVKYLTDKDENRPIQLIYAANTPEEIAFRDLFDSSPAITEVKYMVKQPSPDWDGSTGILDSAKITELAGGLEGKLVYISGPEPMVKSLQQQLIKDGADESQIKIDDFPNYTADY